MSIEDVTHKESFGVADMNGVYIWKAPSGLLKREPLKSQEECIEK